MSKFSERQNKIYEEQREEIQKLVNERPVYSLVSESNIVEEDYAEYLTEDTDTSDFPYAQICLDDRNDAWIYGKVFEVGKTDVPYSFGVYIRYIFADDEEEGNLEIRDCFLVDVAEKYYDAILDVIEKAKEI